MVVAADVNTTLELVIVVVPDAPIVADRLVKGVEEGVVIVPVITADVPVMVTG